MRLKPIFKNADARDHIFSPFRKSVVAQDRLCTKAHVRSDTMTIFLKVCDYLFCVRRMPARPCTQRAPVRSIRLHCPCMYGFCRLSRMSVLFCAPLRGSYAYIRCAVPACTAFVRARAHRYCFACPCAYLVRSCTSLHTPARFVRLHMSAFSLHHARSSTLSCTSAFFLLPCTCLRALHIFAHIGTLLRKHACVCTPLMPAYFAYILHAFARPLHRIVCSRHDGHGIAYHDQTFP